MQSMLPLSEDDDQRVARTEEEVSVCLAHAGAMHKPGLPVGGSGRVEARPTWPS